MNMVLFYDLDSERVSRIPASELRPGAVRVRMDGFDEPVWRIFRQESLVSDPDFEDILHEWLPRIQQAFANHRRLTCEEWRDVILSEDDPDRAFGEWVRATEVFTEFASRPATTSAQLEEAYRLLVCCMCMSPAVSRHEFSRSALSVHTAEEIIRSFQQTTDASLSD